MKIYEEKIIPARKEMVLKTRTCDLCGKSSSREEWESRSIYAVNETEIVVVVRQKDGACYPDNGSGKKYEVDLCPRCFKSKLIPWLISQGATIKREEWDW